MKGKKGIYIMLPLVLLIWVMIIYKIYKTVNGSDDNAIVQFQDTPASSAKLALDTFTLIANYRDPFLGKIVNDYSERKTNINTGSSKNLAPIPTKTITPWPSINYMGIIKNQKSSKQNALIQVNGKELVLKEGDKTDGLILRKIQKDSVEFIREKETRYFKKSS
jgi:type II secretory pathway component PulC